MSKQLESVLQGDTLKKLLSKAPTERSVIQRKALERSTIETQAEEIKKYLGKDFFQNAPETFLLFCLALKSLRISAESAEFDKLLEGWKKGYENAAPTKAQAERLAKIRGFLTTKDDAGKLGCVILPPKNFVFSAGAFVYAYESAIVEAVSTAFALMPQAPKFAYTRVAFMVLPWTDAVRVATARYAACMELVSHIETNLGASDVRDYNLADGKDNKQKLAGIIEKAWAKTSLKYDPAMFAADRSRNINEFMKNTFVPQQLCEIAYPPKFSNLFQAKDFRGIGKVGDLKLETVKKDIEAICVLFDKYYGTVTDISGWEPEDPTSANSKKLFLMVNHLSFCCRKFRQLCREGKVRSGPIVRGRRERTIRFD